MADERSDVYTLTYTRNGRLERHVGTRAAMQALREYVVRTFRIDAELRMGV